MIKANGWPMVPLRELLTRNENTVSLRPDRQYQEVTIRLWGRGVIPRGVVNGADIAADRRVEVSAGQFIISRIDARNGAMGIIPPELDGAIVTNDFPSFNVNRNRMIPEYLGWLCRTFGFVEMCRTASEGTTNRVRLKEDRLMQMRIPLPPLEEQRRIVARIDHLAAKIEEAQEQRRKMNADIAAFAASLHASLSKDRRVRMDSLVELHEERVPVETSGQYPQVGIKGFGGGLFPKPALAGTDTTYRHFNRLDADMLVLSQVKGWEGAIAVCPDELAGHFASPEYRTFRCIEDACDARYLDTVVRSTWFRHLLQRATHGQGARRERTRPERFLTLELPMPELDDQRKAARILSRIAESEPLKSHAAAACDALLPSILDRAFRGAL
jgi:type I restriction enzyme S subunit